MKSQKSEQPAPSPRHGAVAGRALLLQLLLYCLQGLLLSPLSRTEAGISPLLQQSVALLTTLPVFFVPLWYYQRAAKTSFSVILQGERDRHGDNASTAGGVKYFIFAVCVTVNVTNLAGCLSDEFFTLLGQAPPQAAPPSSLPAAALTLLSVAVVAPLCEEALFRGVLLHALRGHGVGAFLTWSTLSFALMHYNLYQLFYALCAGFALSCFAIRTQSPRFTAAVHATCNLIAYLSLTLLGALPPLSYAVFSYSLLAGTAAVVLVGTLKWAINKPALPSPVRLWRNARPSLCTELLLYILLSTLIILWRF